MKFEGTHSEKCPIEWIILTTLLNKGHDDRF